MNHYITYMKIYVDLHELKLSEFQLRKAKYTHGQQTLSLSYLSLLPY